MSERQYSVKVLETGAKKHKEIFVGSWGDCKKSAYRWMLENSPYRLIDEVSALKQTNGDYTPPQWEKNTPHLHVQGDAMKPGYVGYGNGISGLGNLLWCMIDEVPTPEEIKAREAADEKAANFDYNGAINSCIDFVVERIPENIQSAWKQVYADTGSMSKNDYTSVLSDKDNSLFDGLCDESDEGNSGASLGCVQVGTIARVIGLHEKPN